MTEAALNNIFLVMQGVLFGYLLWDMSDDKTAGWTKRQSIGVATAAVLALLGVPVLATIGQGVTYSDILARTAFNGWQVVVALVMIWIYRSTPKTRIVKVGSIVAEADRLASVFDQLPMGAIVLDHDCTILHANQALCADFGYAPAELEGKHVNTIVPHRHHDGHEAKIQSVIDGMVGPSGWRSVVGLHKNGSEIKIKLSVRALEQGILSDGPGMGIGLTELRLK
jgi:PAS domain S-box-containing protein